MTRFGGRIPHGHVPVRPHARVGGLDRGDPRRPRAAAFRDALAPVVEDLVGGGRSSAEARAAVRPPEREDPMRLDTVIYETRDGIAYVRLNRPHRLNAMVPQLMRDLH